MYIAHLANLNLISNSEVFITSVNKLINYFFEELKNGAAIFSKLPDFFVVFNM